MLMDLMKKRYSVRKYSDKEVETEKINQILEAGRIAPTAHNSQPIKIYILKSQESMDKARQVTRMMYDAPMALLVCYDDELSWKGVRFGDPDYDGGEVDCAITTTSMMLEATELGLGSLWVRGFCAQKVSDAFELPQNIHPICFLLLGYAHEDSKPTKSHDSRREIKEIVTIL